MDVLEVKTYPDPCLRAVTGRVEKFDSDLKALLAEMEELMYDSQGIGLAATQVGVGLRAFVMDVGEGLSVFVNPEIIGSSGRKTRLEEGCLSLPGLTVNVARFDEIKVRATDGDGKMFTRDYDGLAAKAVQHELDHLNGKIIIDYLDPVRPFLAFRKLSSKKRDPGGGRCEVVCRVGKKNK